MRNLIRRLTVWARRPHRPHTPPTPRPQVCDHVVVVTAHGINFIPRQPSAADMAKEAGR
ncbi:hypothetical protein [Streptomyces sp. UNOB3_S3]|uniref:hypothetical protein n=1 Tax=Streptomyces sp. UNOB3_S3 TaxID=2871682 RepID=UPI001E338D27|nr:hypothetical protein [Streptomyces sp. UNOB3_S3]MCC3777623.1 hypothetical protein [Streptomyces sp. UNOB3_S3]